LKSKYPVLRTALLYTEQAITKDNQMRNRTEGSRSLPKYRTQRIAASAIALVVGAFELITPRKLWLAFWRRVDRK
jgi:hypothetical protein